MHQVLGYPIKKFRMFSFIFADLQYNFTIIGTVAKKAEVIT